MEYSPGRAGRLTTQLTATQESPSELSIEVIVLGADNLPHIRRWLRMKRRFYVTVTYQDTTTKLASAKFDGQTARWTKKLDTFSVKPPSPFTLRLYAKRFLHDDILVGKTQEILPSVGPTTDLSIDLTKEQAGQWSTRPVKLHLKVTVSVNAAFTQRSTSSPTNPFMTFPRSDHPYPATNSSAPYARPAPSPTPSPTNHIPANAGPDPWRTPPSPTNPNNPFARSAGGSPAANPAPYARPAPSPRPTRSNYVPVDPTPDSRFLSGSNDFGMNVASTSSSSVNRNNSLATSASYAPIVPPKPPRPIAVTASSSSLSPNTADRSAVTPRSSSRLGANVVNDKTSRTRPSGPSTSEFEPATIADIIPTVERRAPSSFSSKPTTPIKANPSPTNTADPNTSRAHQANPPTSIIPAFEPESDIDDIIQTVERFRILSVGRSGVGKSSLINRVFGIDAAQVQNHRPGAADIQREFVSPQNQYFVLHDSQGFEPGDLSNFETVSKFVQERSGPELPLSERIHGLWLCTETPTAGGRIFETGDEKLLQFAHKYQVPLVIVFTQYDRLVRTKEAELREDYPQMDRDRLRELSLQDAQEAFNVCLQSLQRSANRLRIPMPLHARVSVRPGHREDISELVKVTRDIVKERVKGDAWMLWAIAQRASLPLKIEACVTKGINHYQRALMAGFAPGSGPLLRRCLLKVHRDIVTCWNFKGEDLNSAEFRQLMLCLVQDVYTKPGVSSPPAVDVINQFVILATSASAPIAPPVAILGLTYTFVNWLSTTTLENAASVQRLLIAYIVDLIRVLKELFDITLRPELALSTTWMELREAFEAYERSRSRQRIHRDICLKTVEGDSLTGDGISRKVKDLLRDAS